MNIIQIIKESPFQKQYYSVDIELRSLVDSLGCFINNSVVKNIDDILKYGIPEFQRSNDKWSEDMQIKYVENVIKGYKHEIILYTFDSVYNYLSYSRCWILDGLQRLTAIIKFIKGELKVFGGYNYEEIQKHINLKLSRIFSGMVKIYVFKDIYEVVKFYIDINENITHSTEDILKAKQYLKNLKVLKQTKTYNVKNYTIILHYDTETYTYLLQVKFNDELIISYFIQNGFDDFSEFANPVIEFLQSTRLKRLDKIRVELTRLLNNIQNIKER